MMINCNVKNKKSYLLIYLKTTIIHFFVNWKILCLRLGNRVGMTHPATIRGTENLTVRR